MSKILVVDDEPDAMEALRVILELHGHHLSTALDGWEAFECVSGKTPDVVITDWKMPRLDGLGFCWLLRHNQPLSGVPVILVSSEEPPTGHRPRLYDAFIRKPIPVEQLLMLVASLASKQH